MITFKREIAFSTGMIPKRKEKRLQEGLEGRISFLKSQWMIDAEIKASVYSISTGAYASVLGDKPGWAASIIKLPVMINTIKEMEQGCYNPFTRLCVGTHDYMLEEDDSISMLPEYSKVAVIDLIYHMVVESDNEATNLLAEKSGIPSINKTAWDLGLDRTMLGHLLCSGAPRWTSDFNDDGSNLTTTDDMVSLMRHIYDDSYSKLSPYVRYNSDMIMSCTDGIFTRKGRFRAKNIKAKRGVIFHGVKGHDFHETAIIDDDLIVSIMLNKIDQNRP